MTNHLSDGLLVPSDQTNPLIGSRVEVVCFAHLYPRSQLDGNGHGDDDGEDDDDADGDADGGDKDDDDEDDEDDDDDADGGDPHCFLYVCNRLTPFADDGARSNAELKMILERRQGSGAREKVHSQANWV